MSSSMLFRSTLRSLKSVQPILSRQIVVRPTQPLLKFHPPVSAIFTQRHYSSGGTLAKDEVEKRIIEILKGFDKVTDPTKVP
jgi:hypothetical protein